MNTENVTAMKITFERIGQQPARSAISSLVNDYTWKTSEEAYIKVTEALAAFQAAFCKPE